MWRTRRWRFVHYSNLINFPSLARLAFSTYSSSHICILPCTAPPPLMTQFCQWWNREACVDNMFEALNARFMSQVNSNIKFGWECVRDRQCPPWTRKKNECSRMWNSNSTMNGNERQLIWMGWLRRCWISISRFTCSYTDCVVYNWESLNYSRHHASHSHSQTSYFITAQRTRLSSPIHLSPWNLTNDDE